MMHLLAANDKRKERQEEQQHRQQPPHESHLSDGDSSDAPSSSPPSHLLTVPSSSSSSSSFLSSSTSPLSFVSSLSHSLLHSAKSGLKEVRAGVQRGIGGIEAAAIRAQEEEDREQRRREGKEWNGEEEEGDAAEQPHSGDGDDWKGEHRRGSSSLASLGASDVDDDADSLPSSPSSSSSSLPLSVRRVNFLRLLSRCEDVCYRHLHAPPGEVPVLHTRAAGGCQPSPEAQAFFQSVALLQRELRDHFAGASGGRSGRKGGAAAMRTMLHADPKKDTELRRRVGFLATVSEKESVTAAAALSPMWQQPLSQSMGRGLEEKKGFGTRRRFAHVVYPRSAASAASFSTAASSTAAPSAQAHSLVPRMRSLRPAASASSSVESSFDDPTATEEAEVDDFALDGTSAPDSGGGGYADSFANDELALGRLDRSPSHPMDPAQELRSRLFARSGPNRAASASGATAAAGSSAASASASAPGPSADFRAELEQRTLLSELHDMTGALKSNAQRISGALRADARVLESTDALLDENLRAIGVENARLKRWASHGCSEMCWNILLILTLWAVFIATFLFIKIFPAPKPTA